MTIILGNLYYKLLKLKVKYHKGLLLKFVVKAYYALKKHRTPIILSLLAITMLGGTEVYYLYYDLSYFNSVVYAASLFALDTKIPDIGGGRAWELIFIFSFTGALTTFFTVALVFLEKRFHKLAITSNIKNGQHIIVFGLGENNRVYVDSELKDNNKKILIIEKDKNNPYIEYYREQGIGVVIGDALSELTDQGKVNLLNAKHAVVSVGDDLTNLEISIASLIIKNDLQLYVHIEDRKLRHFHKEKGALDGPNVKVFSYYEDVSRVIFEEFDIDGNGSEIIYSGQEYSIVIIGNTPLAHEIIAQATMMGQLPYENQLTIYCVDENAHKFQKAVDLHYTKISDIPNVKIEYLEFGVDSKEFYESDLFNNNITNLIVCYEDEQKNLDIAANLASITYLNAIADKTLNVNILIAMFSGYTFGNSIKENSDIFKNFYIFGSKKEIFDKKYIVGAERDKQAMATDYVYGNIGPKLVDFDTYAYEYEVYDSKHKDYQENGFLQTTSENWQKLSYFKKESNRAVADQMKMKLKYLGLKMHKIDDVNTETLFLQNKQLFDQKLKDQVLLARMEHNRWNTYHFLNGYSLIDFVSVKDKKQLEKNHELKKVHMCLISFDDFKTKADELLHLGYGKGQFEGYDFLINAHIPLIMANAGYEIVERT